MEKEYIERRPERLYVGDTPVSIASADLQFQQGASPETILQKFPALNSLEYVYGAITFYLANQAEVDRYLAGQEQKWRGFPNGARKPPPRRSQRAGRAPGARVPRARHRV